MNEKERLCESHNGDEEIPEAYKCTVIFSSKHQWTKLVVGREYRTAFLDEYLHNKENVVTVVISSVGKCNRDMVDKNDTYMEKNVLKEFFGKIADEIKSIGEKNDYDKVQE